MRLSPKSKDLLEVIFMTGLDLVEASGRFRSVLRHVGEWPSDRYFRRHLEGMKDKGWIIWDDVRETGKWVPRLTTIGKNILTDSIDPEKLWHEKWDKKWRTLTFDLPQGAQAERKRLNVWLGKFRFGHLQGSLWVNPRKYQNWSDQLAKLNIDPSAVLLMEGTPIGKLRNKDILAKAWDFRQIHQRYTTLLDFHKTNQPNQFSELPPEEAFAKWFREETHLWRAVFHLDPFLPIELLPTNYLGRTVWTTRKKAYAKWGTQLQE